MYQIETYKWSTLRLSSVNHSGTPTNAPPTINKISIFQGNSKNSIPSDLPIAIATTPRNTPIVHKPPPAIAHFAPTNFVLSSLGNNQMETPMPDKAHQP